MLLVDNAHPMSPLMLKCTNVLDMFNVTKFMWICFFMETDLEKCSIISCSPIDPLQWMGAVRMRVQTADKNITVIHTISVRKLTSCELNSCAFLPAGVPHSTLYCYCLLFPCLGANLGLLLFPVMRTIKVALTQTHIADYGIIIIIMHFIYIALF